MNVISKDELMRGLLNSKNPILSGLIAIYKEWGKTPLETLNILKEQYPVLKDHPMSYAGRLDPLAEGLMLVLVGDTNKDREKYLHLDKTYEVEVLFGIKSDTGDLFGIPTINTENAAYPFQSSIVDTIATFVGKHSFPYPVYSSKTVQGKPLFQWTNEGRISEIEIPKKDIEIYNLEITNESTVSGDEILKKVEVALEKVNGDFRYEEMKMKWNDTLVQNKDMKFSILKIKCECSSGTYMRVLAEEIGNSVGLNSLAYSIKRTRVGDIDVKDSIHI